MTLVYVPETRLRRPDTAGSWSSWAATVRRFGSLISTVPSDDMRPTGKFVSPINLRDCQFAIDPGDSVFALRIKMLAFMPIVESPQPTATTAWMAQRGREIDNVCQSLDWAFAVECTSPRSSAPRRACGRMNTCCAAG